jgi:hypothetical protein
MAREVAGIMKMMIVSNLNLFPLICVSFLTFCVSERYFSESCYWTLSYLLDAQVNPDTEISTFVQWTIEYSRLMR